MCYNSNGNIETLSAVGNSGWVKWTWTKTNGTEQVDSHYF